MAPVQREEYPNFTFIRLVAAASVIFSHSFVIGEDNEAREPFVQLLGHGSILGIYGVFCFFIVSGFLVTQSLIRSESTLNYLWRRFLRIYPGLFACLVLCAFILAPWFSRDGTLHFLGTFEGSNFVLGNLLKPGHVAGLPSVVFYENPTDDLGALINGSLWTIFHEVACYIILGLIFLMGLLRAWMMAVLAIGMCLVNFLGLRTHLILIDDFKFVAPAFFAGVTVCLLSLKMTWSRTAIIVVASTAALAIVLAIIQQKLLAIFPLAGAPLILLLATTTWIQLPTLKSAGDISYGVYLYGWPVQQAVRSIAGPGWLIVFVVPLVIACGIGFLSWRFIEKPALRFKDWLK